MQPEDQNIITTEELQNAPEIPRLPDSPDIFGERTANLEQSLRQANAAAQVDLSTKEKDLELAQSDISSLLGLEQDKVAREASLKQKMITKPELDNLKRLQAEIDTFSLSNQDNRDQLEQGLRTTPGAERIGSVNQIRNDFNINEQRRKTNLIKDFAIAQGRIEVANQLIEQQIDVEFAPQEAELVQKQANLNYLKTQVETGRVQLSKEEEKQFKLQENLAAEERKAIDKEKEQAREEQQRIVNLAKEAMSNGAPSSLVSKIAKASTQAEALEASGPYGVKISDRIAQTRRADEVRAQEAVNQAAERGELTQDQVSKATSLRKEYNSLLEVKGAKDIQANTKALLQALNEGDKGSGVGDISAINTFQRLAVDPGVAVREGDVALLQSAQSFGDKQALKARGLLVGNKLTATAREQMRTLALEIHDSRVGFVEDQTAPIKKTADVMGIPFNEYIASPFKTSQEITDSVNLVPSVSGVVVQDGKITLPGVSMDDIKEPGWAMKSFQQIETN